MNQPEKEIRRQEAAAEWVVHLAGGSLPAERELAFELWLQEDDENRKLLERMVMLWDGTPLAGGEPELIGVRADALQAMRNAHRHRWSRRFAGDWRVVGVAACLLIIVLLGWAVFRGRPDIYTTGVGEQRIVALADGSKLFLDADTQVAVALSDERRSLQLIAGRAKFDVAKDPRRPFTVDAGGHMVVATGTSFSVEILHSTMQVVLYEGSVAVLEDGPSDAPPRHVALAGTHEDADRLLKPGTALIATADESAAVVHPVDPPRSLSWQKGQLAFSSEPLSNAVERINRYSPKRVVVTDPHVGAIRISGVFDEGDTAGFIDGVTNLYQLHAARDGDVTILTAANP